MIVNKLAYMVKKRPLLFSLSGATKLAADTGSAREVLREISKTYDVSGLSAKLDEYFLIGRKLSAVRVMSLNEADKLIREGEIDPVALVRYWPTIPPHFSAEDIKFSMEHGIKILSSFTLHEKELHVFIGEANLAKCLEARRRLASKLIAMADKMAIGRTSEAHPEEPDEAELSGKSFILYPHVEESDKWRKATEELYSAYMKAMLLPQYVVFRLA